MDSIWASAKQMQPQKIILFLASIFLFILAIMLMREGAHDLTPFIREHVGDTNATHSLGFGWLSAYILMSGSPVAAAALTFFEAGILDKLSAFAMITGSRLGASFIVLFIGFLYVLRGRDRATGLSMGLLSLTVTGTTYLFGLIIGVLILQTGLLDSVRFQPGFWLTGTLDLIFSPIIKLLLTVLSPWLLFPVGLGLIMLSFSLFDRCLPQAALKESQVGQVSRLVYRPGVMFALGAAITLLSMSVTISLSLLVPLSNRGFIRRENVIPYIMGANVTTFIDTLLVAVLVENPTAFTIVLAGMVSIFIVSVIILGTIYRPYERALLACVAWITAEKQHLLLFMGLILITPILLMVI